MTEQVKHLMQRLGVTEEEALDIIKTDLEIDKGADPFPLSTEQKKVAKANTISTKADKVYTFRQTSRKADTDKQELIALLAESLDKCDSVEIANQEREIALVYHGRKFKITLSAPRN